MILWVKESGESKSFPVIGKIEVATFPHAKAGRLPLGFKSRDNLKKRNKEIRQMAGEIKISNGAISATNNWYAIDWQAANKVVRRLQARIVKATQERRWNKVQALQRLLTSSFSAKAMAVKRVTGNTGKRTSGVDKILWDTASGKYSAIKTLKRREYKPLPLRRIYIPKKNGSLRPLSIPTMKDRAMQALYLLALEPISETLADPSSYGFRKERSTHDAIEQCFTRLSRKVSAQWILEGDIKACFDTISHQWLLDNIPVDKQMLGKWLKAGFIEHKQFNPSEKGTPQGGIISPTLANMALDGIEIMLKKRFKPKTRKEHPKVHMIRYADDFIITGKSKAILEEEVLPMLKEFLQVRGLQLSAEKTLITHIADGFNFLGRNIRKYNGKLIIKPSKDNIKSFILKVRQLIKSNKASSAGELIAYLNPLIKGWTYFHRHTCSSKVFSKVDADIFKAIWKWALRRHRKGKRWIKAKYFKPNGTRMWTFTGSAIKSRGRYIVPKLQYASDVKIKSFNKIKAEANPFAPEWEQYFEDRLMAKTEISLQGQKQTNWLWKEQRGRCPICHLAITKESGWHKHRIVWRSMGGGDTSDNLVLLHPDCHHKLHYQNLKIEKPRSFKKSVIEA